MVGIFEREAETVRVALAGGLVSIEHVGSTSVPGLRAKPIIDLLVAVADYTGFESWRRGLETAGYDYTPQAELDDPARKVFRKGPAGDGEMRTHHLHMTLFGSAYWRRLIAFRDALRSDPVIARRYETLKMELAARFPADGRAYTNSKADFVREVESSVGLPREISHQSQ